MRGKTHFEIFLNSDYYNTFFIYEVLQQIQDNTRISYKYSLVGNLCNYTGSPIICNINQ